MVTISAIKLNEEFNDYKDFAQKKISECLLISKVNVFVGANNSGKSRFLRLLFSLYDYQIQIQEVDQEKTNNKICEFLSNIINEFTTHKISSINEINLETIKSLISLPKYLNFQSDVYSHQRHDLPPLVNLPKNCDFRSNPSLNPDSQKPVKIAIQTNSKSAIEIVENIPVLSPNDKPKNVYISVLRGLRPISNDISKDYYSERTKKDYFPEHNLSNHTIFSGLGFYQKLKNLLLGENKERRLIVDYQNYLSETFFENQPIALIPNEAKEVVIIKIGKEFDKPIYHLGDGIQSIIILTFLPFITPEPTFYFIEEPELYLHPGMQRKIMDFFSSQKGNLKNHYYFLTTHSNHFLDLTIDYPEVTIFNFRKKIPDIGADDINPEFLIEPVDIGNKSSLECLGVRNSSVFLVNATIWVEGITDRLYLREMLQKYMEIQNEDGNKKKKFEEDVHYSFVEYGGSNITHWSFLDFSDNIAVETLCGKALLIIDKDGEENKLERKEDLRKKIGERLKILNAREIENTLPPNVIKKVISEYENCPEEDIPEFKYEDYQEKYLGKYIEEEILQGNKGRKGSYQSKSGTISDKVVFCKKALPYIKFEELPESTKELIGEIYQFIKKQNK